MNSEAWGARKVVIVGAGAVGATFAYALAQSGISDEIILIDHNRELAQGQVLDLAHGFPFFPPVEIRAGEAENVWTDRSIGGHSLSIYNFSELSAIACRLAEVRYLKSEAKKACCYFPEN